MKLKKGIFLASITTPIIVFLIIFLTSFFFLLAEYVKTGTGLHYIGGGLVGGAAYAIGTAVISVPATFLIGYPISKYAIQKGSFSFFNVFTGAAILGAATLPLLVITFLTKYTEPIVYLSILIGAFGGLFNGATLWLYMKKT